VKTYLVRFLYRYHLSSTQNNASVPESLHKGHRDSKAQMGHSSIIWHLKELIQDIIRKTNVPKMTWVDKHIVKWLRINSIFFLFSFSRFLQSSQAVKRYMKKECKCHGLSGSCTVRTCWKKMPHFRDVGDRLKARFDGAIKVLFSNKGDRLIKERETIKDPTDLDLVYTATSPSFCKENPSLGSHGTVGRQCNDTSMGVEGCQLLCCGRGARATKTTVVKHCQCRFMWCCRVKCKKCRQEVEVHTCA